jgi:ribosome assembly protein YihI (activator of Der GTPase)
VKSARKNTKKVGYLTEEKFDRKIASLATKEGLREAVSKLATKEGLREAVKKLATKEELRQEIKKLATKEELSRLEERLRFEIRLSAQELEERLDEKSRQYRDQILNTMNDFLEEIKASRDERVVMGAQVSRNSKKLENHEKRITTLEKHTAVGV